MNFQKVCIVRPAHAHATRAPRRACGGHTVRRQRQRQCACGHAESEQPDANLVVSPSSLHTCKPSLIAPIQPQLGGRRARTQPRNAFMSERWCETRSSPAGMAYMVPLGSSGMAPTRCHVAPLAPTAEQHACTVPPCKFISYEYKNAFSPTPNPTRGLRASQTWGES
jgi:hypothetical protein